MLGQILGHQPPGEPCRPEHHHIQLTLSIHQAMVETAALPIFPTTGKPLSTWLAEAAATKLRAEALAEFLDDWEAEHGAFTAEELAEASRALGLRPRLSETAWS